MKRKSNQAGDSTQSMGMDQCQTPPIAAAPLLPFLWSGACIWEPATGEGYLAGALEAAGYDVTKSDILTGQSFFDWQPNAFDVLVTNPPYSIKYLWLERCYKLGRPFALLVPVETIGAGKAQALFRRYGVEILLLNRRVNFKMPHKGWGGSAQFPVLWLCWQLLPAALMFGELPTREPAGKQLRLLEAA